MSLRNSFSDFFSRLLNKKKKYNIEPHEVDLSGIRAYPRCTSLKKMSNSNRTRKTVETVVNMTNITINRSQSLTALESTSYMELPKEHHCSQSVMYLNVISPTKPKDACLVEDENGEIVEILLLQKRENNLNDNSSGNVVDQ